MRPITWLSMVPLALLPSFAQASPPAVSTGGEAIASGSAATVTYSQVSADGCLVTSGEIAVVDSILAGEVADGIYITAVRENICTGTGGGWAGFADDGAFGVLGLVYGYYSGTVVIDEYSGSGAAPLTFELDLRWLGKGPITPTHDFYDDGTMVSFSLTAIRGAVTRGGVTIDGDAASITSAQLANQTSGQISH